MPTTDSERIMHPPGGYAPEPGTYDEMEDGEGRVRPHWRGFVQALEQMGGVEELERRRLELRRRLRENGVTYSVPGDPHGRNRPWELDPVPLIISAEDWEVLEAGLQQRARLLDLLLTDLYGRRELLGSGLLPPELVYSHRGFLLPCDQVLQPGAQQLLVYAADLARGPDGRMWVVGDRTQAPSGSGYALENRTAMARVLPGLFRDCQVRRLARFFRGVRASLAERAPESADPRIVLLTPGPHNETYFEHAYLAAYLGYALVQGQDLTVRAGRVWLRSLQGLRPVEVILRRVDDHFCDPLELRPDSRLGVAGLLEAVRRGRVVVANPLGSSLLENPGLMAFLPGICRHLLGEELALPSAATWWCGQERERDYVLENLERLVIYPIYSEPGTRAVSGARLPRPALESWRARIRARPHLYVGQEQVSFSTTPALVDGRLEPRQAILRTYLVARSGDYVAMPGGLTRSAPERGNVVSSNQAGSIAKDTWVLALEPEEHVSLWLQPEQHSVAADSGALPSQAAENLFWVGRYAERAEATARLLRTVLRHYSEGKEMGGAIEGECLEHLLAALTHVTATYPGFVGEGARERRALPEDELYSLVLDGARIGTLSTNLQAVLEAAYVVRDLWSADTWRVIEGIEEQRLELELGPQPSLRRVQNHLDSLVTGLVALAGLNMESMPRDLGWLLLDCGRRLERGLLLIALLRATLVPRRDERVEHLLMEAVLSTTESLNAFRQRYRAYMHLPNVLDLLLMDGSHPRSLLYQLEEVRTSVAELPRERDGHRLSAEERLSLEALTRLRLVEVESLVAGAGVHEGLETLLSGLAELLAGTTEALSRNYFVHAQGPQQLAPTRQENER